MQIAEKTLALAPEHPDVGDALNTLATLYFNQDNEKQAQPLFQRAFDNLFQQFQYNFGSMSEKERLAFLGTLEFRFPVYFSFVQRFRQQDPQLIGSMYNLFLWEKGFVASSVANLRRRVEASGDAESIKLLNDLTAKRAEIASLLNVKPPDRALWRKQIDQLRADSNDIEKSLVARSAAFVEKQKLERATWQQVRDALKPGEAAVEFARFDFYDKKWTDTSYYVALFVTPETKDEPQYIVLGDDNQIEGSAITSFEHAVETRGLEQETEAQLPGADAYRLIWSPLEKALAGTTRLYLSPDGILNQLPIGIIPAPDGKLLMERFDLRFVSSTKDILGVAPGPAAKSAVLIGDPLFDLSEQQQFASLKSLALPQQPLKNQDLPALASMSGTRGKAKVLLFHRFPARVLR